MNDTSILQRTVKFKLTLSEEQAESLMVCLRYSKDIFNLFTGLSCEHRTCSYTVLHKFGYEKAKEMCPGMPTAYIQAIAKNACGAVKSFNSQHKKQKFRYSGKRRKMALPLNKLTFSKRGNLMTISTVGKRIRVLAGLPEWFAQKYEIEPNKVQAGQIVYNPHNRKQPFTISLTYRIQKKASGIKDAEGKLLVGIDRGLYNLYATSLGELCSAKKIICVRRKIQYLRSRLQARGTRSAKRFLKSLSGREMRFARDCNHCVTKKLASDTRVSAYILEDLRGIRKHRRGRKLNSWLSRWPFYQFQCFLEYKCALNGIEVRYIDPRYTSQKCSACGMIDKEARKKSRYICKRCGHQEHADINASKNIRDNYASQQKEKTGCLQPTDRISL